MEKGKDQGQPRGLTIIAFGALVVWVVLSRVTQAEVARLYGILPPPVARGVDLALLWYGEAEAYGRKHWLWLVPACVLGVLALLIAYRSVLLCWRNVIVAKLAGVELEARDHAFRKHRFDIYKQLAATPADHYYVAQSPKRRPVYLTERDLCTHLHLMGHTGSGKTASVIFPLLYQCLVKGKGVLFMDAKGSSENVATMQRLATKAQRHNDLRVFSLAYPDWSHTYNPVWPCRDPDATAERIFSVFDMENEYYRGQAWLMFRNLIRLAVSTGKPFSLMDIRCALVDDEARERLCQLGTDIRAKREIESQLAQLGKRVSETFTGLYNALARYDHPLLNSYTPSIVLENLVNRRGVCYFNLPANLYPILAPAVGKIVVQHMQSIGALRQVDRGGWDQEPFFVCLDEVNRFAFPNLVPALCMLRDAKVQFLLSHQSLGDLEQVSPVFARQIKDNTRCKIYLYENDPDHLEQVSRSYGTETTFKRTVRFSLGPLWTFLNTGEVSNREVEEFRLHPNALKALQPFGQGYLLLPDRSCALNLEMLEDVMREQTPQPRNLVREEYQVGESGLHLMKTFLAGEGVA